MPMFRMSGRTLGILGFGKIGQTLASKRGLGFKLIAHDPFLPESVFGKHQTESVSLDELFHAVRLYQRSHAALAANPPHGEQRALAKNEAHLLSRQHVRGGVVDQTALILALQDHWIAGAGLDVFEPERLSPDHPLLHVPNLLTTPHVAFYSEESVVELEIKAAENESPSCRASDRNLSSTHRYLICRAGRICKTHDTSERGSTHAAGGRLERVLRAGLFAVTAELNAPDSAEPQEVYDATLVLSEVADAINATDASGANVHMSSLGMCALLLRSGYEVVLQMSCRDRNRIASSRGLARGGGTGRQECLVHNGR